MRLRWTEADKKNGSRLSGHVTVAGDEAAPTITRRSEYALVLCNPKHPVSVPDEPSMTVCAKDRGGAQGARVLAWPWDRPSTTICADERQPPPGRNGRNRNESQRGHPNAVVLSERAATILQGFPESWKFAGKTKRSRWAQIGQAMCPGLAYAVAKAITERQR